MSRKTKTTATKEEAKPALVPKLRFPEFRDAAGWKPSVLADACDMQAGKFVSASNISERNQDGLFPCYGGNGLRGYAATHTHNGTYPLVGRQGALCGNVRLATGRFHATEHAVVATPKKGIDVVWLFYSLDLLNLNRFATGQAQPGLSVDVLENVSVAIPPLEPEQQKIAECLSAVDELIAAQAQKLDALKTHKKGLMQQLFPREGETQPRLRFPEFQNAGEWEQKPLGSLCRIRTGKKDANEGAADGVYPFFTCAEKHIYSHGYSFDAEAILIAGNANVGQTNYYQGKFEAYQRTYVLTDFQGIFVPYLYSVLNANLRPDLLAQVQTSAMSYIRLPMLEEYQINAPSSQDEQQRIASCLSSLDDLIVAQTQKLEALKTHKKGLMQQLFPSPENCPNAS